MKINNYNEFKTFVSNLEEKPKLLLHACCGPCSTGVLDRLVEHFDVTIYYANDNIDTLAEFEKRQAELLKVAGLYQIRVVTKKYEPKYYYEAVKGLEDLGEFSQRCYNCIKERMTFSAKYAKDNNFSYFTTTLSVSPYKSSKDINEIGYMLEEEIGVSYLYSDFKKEEGYKLSVKNSRDMNLYRQEYCGCIYSREEHEKRSHN